MKASALAALEENTPNVARRLRLIANKERIRILCRLVASKEEPSIAALAAGTNISQSALSQHLTKLREGGIISARRAGHNSFFRLADDRAKQLAIGLQTLL